MPGEEGGLVILDQSGANAGVHAGAAVAQARMRAMQLQLEREHWAQMYGLGRERIDASREHWGQMYDLGEDRLNFHKQKYGDLQSQQAQTSLGLDQRAAQEGMIRTGPDGNPDPAAMNAFSMQDIHTKGLQLTHYLIEKQHSEDAINNRATLLQRQHDALNQNPAFQQMDPMLQQAMHLDLDKKAGPSVAKYMLDKRQTQKTASDAAGVMDPTTGQPLFSPDEVKQIGGWSNSRAQSYIAQRMSRQQQVQQQAQGLEAAGVPEEQAVGRAQAGPRMAPLSAGRNAMGPALKKQVENDPDVLSAKSHLDTIDKQLMRVSPYMQAQLHAKLLNDREGVAQSLDDATQKAITKHSQPKPSTKPAPITAPAAPTDSAVPPPKDAVDAAIDAAIAAERGQQ